MFSLLVTVPSICVVTTVTLHAANIFSTDWHKVSCNNEEHYPYCAMHWYEVGQIHAFHLIYAKIWLYHLNVTAKIQIHWTRKAFSDTSCLFQSVINCCEAVWRKTLFFIIMKVWSSAAKVKHFVHLGKAFCLQLVVLSAFWTWCCLFVIWPFCVNMRDGYVWKTCSRSVHMTLTCPVQIQENPLFSYSGRLLKLLITFSLSAQMDWVCGMWLVFVVSSVFSTIMLSLDRWL